MRGVGFLFFLGFLFFSCTEENRKNYPVSYGQENNFIEISKKNNKKILEIETELIKQYVMKRDSLIYKYMGDGYWMAIIESSNKKDRVKADKNDEVHYTFRTYSLANQLIYSRKENGLKKERLDKANIFRGLYYALQNIEEGTRVSLIFPSALAYGFFGDEKKIRPLTPIVLDLKINKIVKHHE